MAAGGQIAGRVVDEFRSARRDRTLAVLEGFHAVKHALRFGAEFLRVLTYDVRELERLCARLAPDVAQPLGGLVEEVERDVFARLAPRPPHTGVIAIARRPEADPSAIAADAPCVFLEEPNDASNLGACVRVAAAAGASALFASGRRDPWSPDALRGSAGLHFALPVLHGEPELPGRPLVALDPDGAPLDPRALPPEAVLAFGSERAGVSEELARRADAVLALPMTPGVSSLNLATSVSAVLFAWRLVG